MLCHMLGWCYALADVIASFIMEDVISYGHMLLPIFSHLADVIAFFITVVVGMTLHYMFSLIMAGVIAKWQDGTATFLCFEDGRCYCHVARWNSHFYIERWQMLLPCGRWNSHYVNCDGRCYCQVADGITTQSGWWYLVDVITKLADGIAIGSIFLCYF